MTVVVVVQDRLRTGQPGTSEEHGPVPGLDAPRPAGDRLGCVDHRQVDLLERGDAIEQRRPVRSRLGEDGGHARSRCRHAPRATASQDSASRRALRARTLLRDRRVDEMSGKRRVEASRLAQHEPTGRALGPRVRAGPAFAPPLRGPRRLPYAGLERTHELDERPNGLLGALTLDGSPAPTRHASSDCSAISPGATRSISRQRHAALEVALQTATRLRGLACVDAIEKERLGEVVAVCMREQPRPQLVVLALEVPAS